MGDEQTSEQTSIDQAQRVARELEDRRRLLLERKQELDESRQRVSFDALTGDAKAKALLEKLNTEAQRHGLDMENLLAAIAQAEANVAAVCLKEEREQEKASARELKKLIEDMLEHGAVVDDCLADLVTAGNNLQECFDRLSQLHISSPRFEQLATLGHLCILTALNASIWRRGFEMLAPGQRKTFGDVVAAWRVSLMADVQRRLGEGESEHTEEAA
jgi:hypothetical protein